MIFRKSYTDNLATFDFHLQVYTKDCDIPPMAKWIFPLNSKVLLCHFSLHKILVANNHHQFLVYTNLTLTYS